MFRFSAISRLTRLQWVTTDRRSKSTKSLKIKQKRKMIVPEQPTSSGGMCLPPRFWVHTKLQTMLDTGKSTVKPTQTTFTVVSYNILAQDLIESHEYLYDGIPKEFLDWNNRKANLITEIAHLQPDIICLQEIQADHLDAFAADLAQMCQFEKVFKRRTGSEKTDGCAIFFNANLFEVVNKRTIEFNQQRPLLNRDNVGIAVQLRSKMNPEAVFIVATTHLLFNLKRDDVRLAQVQVLLAELEQMAFCGAVSKSDQSQEPYYPIILTGDFNMQPNCPPFKLIEQGRINYEELIPNAPSVISNDLGITDNCQHVQSLKNGRKKHQSQLSNSERGNFPARKSIVNCGFKNRFNTGTLTHPLHLNSTYCRFTDRSSTHHLDWTVVDYIFYSRYFNTRLNRVCEGALKLLSYFELPLTTDCQLIEGMPNKMLGSDHFSLAARFLLDKSTPSKACK